MEQTHAKRLVVLDTETTGLSHQEGNRIIEIGGVELIDRRLTGNNFHVYINPERDSEAGALAVHGLTTQFLANKPKFAEIAKAFIDYISGSELVIHNAPFDLGFLNSELLRLKNFSRIEECCPVFDTLVEAKKRYPGQRNNLDALCKRFSIDNSHRELHGALLDAQILADVFLFMTGGQFSLVQDSSDKIVPSPISTESAVRIAVQHVPLKILRCNQEELQIHEARLDAIQKSGQCLWRLE